MKMSGDYDDEGNIDDVDILEQDAQSHLSTNGRRCWWCRLKHWFDWGSIAVNGHLVAFSFSRIFFSVIIHQAFQQKQEGNYQSPGVCLEEVEPWERHRSRSLSSESCCCCRCCCRTRWRRWLCTHSPRLLSILSSPLFSRPEWENIDQWAGNCCLWEGEDITTWR